MEEEAEEEVAVDVADNSVEVVVAVEVITPAQTPSPKEECVLRSELTSLIMVWHEIKCGACQFVPCEQRLRETAA